MSEQGAPVRLIQSIYPPPVKKPSRPKNLGGRPTVMTDEIIENLKQAFLMDCTDEEACQNAGISPGTLYNYQRENAWFLQEKELWKQNPFLKARQTVYNALNDPLNARWYLERKKKKEFSVRNELTGPDGTELPTPIYGGKSATGKTDV